QRVLLAANYYGVTGVVSTVKLHHVIDLRAELVGRLALAFVSPLGTEDYYGWHGIPHFRLPTKLFGHTQKSGGPSGNLGGSYPISHKSLPIFCPARAKG